MNTILDELLAANHAYREQFGEKGKLGVAPARSLAVLTCMDARLDPARLLGLREGDAHVLRNAGGFATDDALQALRVSYTLGTRDWVVIHHTHCAAQKFPSDPRLEGVMDRLAAGVRDQIEWMAAHPLVPEGVSVYGCIYDVTTGRLHEVPHARQVSRPRAA